MTPELKEKMEKLAEAERIYEPKYGGKDRSGYDTLMKYEVNDDRESSFIRGAEAMFKEVEPRLKELEDEQYWHRELKKDFNKQVLKCADLEAELEEFREENTRKFMKLKTAEEALGDSCQCRRLWNTCPACLALKSLKGESV